MCYRSTFCCATSLIYGVDDTPPLHVTARNGVRHVSLIAINLIYPVLVFRVAATHRAGRSTIVFHFDH